MFYLLREWVRKEQKIRNLTFSLRYMTTTEVSAALRPFYFSVHPDLFEQYPNQRTTNENSLQQLSSFIKTLQARQSAIPCNLQFYLRDKANEGDFRLINIFLKEKDVRATVLTVLQSCKLSTEYVDKIPKSPKPEYNSQVKISYDIDFTNVDENDPVLGAFAIKKTIKETKDSITLQNWLNKNYKIASEKYNANSAIREETSRLTKTVINQLGLLDIRWDCGWNEQHFIGCLQSLISLTEMHPEEMHMLKGKVLSFALFTGVSLDGYIMLNSSEVRHNWLDLIKKVTKHDDVLRRIPAFEKSVSQVLRNIKVGRRKFMPKILAGEYERQLQQITTTVCDYLTSRTYPKNWPISLNDFEIVVESEAGPLMLSPTGQFIVPSSCPGFLLVNFISENMDEAMKKTTSYKKNKHIERLLRKDCINELKLSTLNKGDNVTPDLMIISCKLLLDHKGKLENFKNLHLTITNYYSVLSDGVVCIPWNWKI